MTAIDTVRRIMENHDISLNELTEYADMGTKSKERRKEKQSLVKKEFGLTVDLKRTYLSHSCKNF